ncbi:MAG: tetratricopeptide repeat protein [Planctomycetota bacterium]
MSPLEFQQLIQSGGDVLIRCDYNITNTNGAPAETSNDLIEYLRSCRADALEMDNGAAPDASAALVRTLNEQQRSRFARCLLELSVASIRVARKPGDFLPAPQQIILSTDWLDRVERLRVEFLAHDNTTKENVTKETAANGGAARGFRTRIVERLNRELLLARDARARALRCIRMARQLRPDSGDVEHAFLYLRAKRKMTSGISQSLKRLALRAPGEKTRARAFLSLGSLYLQKNNLSRAIYYFEKSLQIVSNDPETLARIAYAALASGREEHASLALEAIAQIEREQPGAPGLDDALQFLKSAEAGFPRIFVANGTVVTRLQKAAPEFTLTLLDAVQRFVTPALRRRARLPHQYIRSARRALRVSWAALVCETEPGVYEILDSDYSHSYVDDLERARELLQNGGPCGVIAKCAEIGDVAIVHFDADSNSYIRLGARGAAAVRVESCGLPPAYFVIESQRPLSVDPPTLELVAEGAVGAACALWLAHAAAARGGTDPVIR